jgi:galactokinase
VKDFDERFGAPPEVTAAAPGRVNLLGEHTDYNEGLVLPTSISQRTTVAMRMAAGPRSTVYSANLGETAEFAPGEPPSQQFAKYVYGCIEEARSAGEKIPALEIHIASDVPIGVGLSSSAALEVATLRALRELIGLPFDDVTVARLAQQAEIRHAGVNCGVLDQMASSLLEPGSMLFLDTRTLERRLLPLPANSEVLVIDSGVTRSLAGSRYNERRAECEEAARKLGVPSLRDVEDLAAVDHLAEPWRRRARHVVTENERVREALGAGAQEFGRLMNASHESLVEDYEVSIAQLDALAALMQGHQQVYGAKLTGAGFGGACVGLGRAGRAAEVGAEIVSEYNRSGRNGRVLVPSL